MILKEARRAGATVVQVNHPFNPYGYFASLKTGVAPGGFNPGFDLIEINSSVPNDDRKVLAKLWEFWNAASTTTSLRAVTPTMSGTIGPGAYAPSRISTAR